MRYSLLASASLIAVVFTMSGSAQAADCGCRDAVRAALSSEKVMHAPVVKKPVMRKPVAKKEPVRKPAALPMAHAAVPPAGDCGCRDTVRAALAQGVATQAAPMPLPDMTPVAPVADAEAFYDYASARPIDMYPFTHHWAVAPQGYVPPMAMGGESRGAAVAMASGSAVTFAAPAMTYEDQDGGAPDLPPMAFAPQDTFMVYGNAAAASSAATGGVAAAMPAPVARYEDGITIEQNGWIGGVGRAALFGGGGGGGGGGGEGQSISLARPDSLNGPSYNSFNESYGGDYQSADVINQMRQQAFAPQPAATTPNTGTVSH